MNESEHLDRPAGTPSAETPDQRTIDEFSVDELSIYERIIPRVLRNMLVVSVLLLGPVFWFYGWAGSIGFAFGAAVSYVNFRSLTRGVEGLADRIVNRSSREKAAGLCCVSWCATGWWAPLPMLYSRVLRWLFAAFCGACACRWRP
jgi:hypothetical protein